MPKIVQFLHTALEAVPENNANIIGWNNYKEHRRKFLMSNGKFVDNNHIKDDELVFWGEWEAQSHVTNLNNKKVNFPKYLNKPFLDPTVPERTHNTDPYVFGKYFRYIVCKQGYYEILRNLDPFSIILFGSSINKEFCLDTVFVVSNDIQKYSMNNIEQIFKQRDQYYYASVNPLYDDTKFNKEVDEENTCRIDGNKEYSFYKGVCYDEKDNYKGIYSFVPSKIYDIQKESNYVFKQPKLDLEIISHTQTQGINTGGNKEYTIEEIIYYWSEIVKQVEKKNLRKSVFFSTPKLERK